MRVANSKVKQSANIINVSSARHRRARKPDHIIKDILSEDDAYKHWELVTKRFASIRYITQNLAQYLTECVPSAVEQKPLLAVCIECALNNWLNGQSRLSNQKYYAYVKGLLYPLPEVLEWSLQIDLGETKLIWNPLEETMTSWWNGTSSIPKAVLRNRPIDTAYVELNPADYRFLVLIKYLLKGKVALTPMAPYFDDLVSRYE